MIDIIQCGAVSNDTTSQAAKANLAAFAKAQKDHPGERIHIPIGVFRLEANLEFASPVVVSGEGRLSGSTLLFAPGCGVVVGENAAWSSFSDFQIDSEEMFVLEEVAIDADHPRGYAMSRAATNTHGFTLHGRVSLHEIHIGHFGGCGILAWANMLDNPSNPNPTRGNTNGTTITNCSTYDVGRSGIEIGGGDGNMVRTYACDLIAFGEHGIYDHSLAGGTHVANDAESGLGRSYWSTNQSTWVGNYGGDGAEGALIESPGVWVNGPTVLDPASTGLIIDGNDVSNATFRGPSGDTRGGLAHDGGASWFRNMTDSEWHSRCWSGADLAWLDIYANMMVSPSTWRTGAAGRWNSESGQIVDRIEHARGAGKFGVTELHLGTSSSNVRMTVGDAGPPSDGQVGDVHWSATPEVGKPNLWRCFGKDDWKSII